MRGQHQHKRGYLAQKGIALAYILGVITLASAVTVFVATTQRGQALAKLNAELRVAIIDQFGLIRSRAIGCVISYPAGNNGTAFHTQFPATPVSTLVRDLTCPGQPGANNLWTGTGGLPLPLPPPAFAEWRYFNDASNIRLTISSAAATDRVALGVMDAVAKRLGPNSSISGDTLTIVLAN